MTDAATEMRALLTRAADLEARRQAAQRRGDEPAERMAEDELRALWRRYTELEAACFD